MTAPRDPDPPHGVADWPDRTEPAPPAALPDGRPWPSLRVLIAAADGEPGLADSIASVANQTCPDCRYEVVPPGPVDDAIPAGPAPEYLLVLRAGDLLAPGALTALRLDATLSGAAATAGLRVLFDRTVIGLDVPAEGGVAPETGVPFTGGEVLWSRSALADLGPLDLTDPLWAAHAWAALAETRAGTRRIGRPVLLQRATGQTQPHTRSLSIASLTGTGHTGGAGIAHRRIGEALRLAGHRVADVRLDAESPAVAAEWTDRFPIAEAGILAGGYDLVLAGNLHGATRSLDAVGRLAAAMSVGLVLHDLFPLTGRCAHPRGCPRIEGPGCDAACPTPDEYPELARGQIAAAYEAKRAVIGPPNGPVLLANSAWTEARADALSPPGTAIASVALAFPTGVFRPRDRRVLRRELGLPEHDLLILVSAVVLDGPDKNVGDLTEALRRVAGPGIGFVAVGRLDHPGRLALPNLFAAGLVVDEASLAAWYGACDLHVTASRLETLGQTPIEAGLCGVPTLAYRTAGLTSSVIDGVSGRLVPVEPGSLGTALEVLVADRAELARLGAFARIALESRFSPAACALSLDAVLRGRGLIPEDAGRPRFEPAMLGHFPFAAAPLPAAAGTVAPQAGRFVQALRRIKHRLLGRRLPHWLRRALYLTDRLRRARPAR